MSADRVRSPVKRCSQVGVHAVNNSPEPPLSIRRPTIQYMKKQISDEDFIKNMTGPGNQKLVKDLLSALKIDEKMSVNSIDENSAK